jgi:hypothetical protein
MQMLQYAPTQGRGVQLPTHTAAANIVRDNRRMLVVTASLRHVAAKHREPLSAAASSCTLLSPISAR